jgi:probable F420-dependent oxidoreductase
VKLGIMTPVLTLTPGKYAEWESGGTIEDVCRIARAAEELGYEYLTCCEHIAVPQDPTGEVPTRGPRYWDPLPTFGYLAGHTSRIRFTTLVLVLPYHHPLDIAKRYGTLDRICGGRLNLGVGVGYLKPEFELLGVPFDDRNERSDDALRALRSCFGRTEPEYDGPYFKFSGLTVDPCGVQERVPLWIGGQTRRSLRRAIELGDAWTPFSLSVERLSTWLSEAAATDAWHERETALDVACSAVLDPLGAPESTAAEVRRFQKAGVTTLSLRFDHDSIEHYIEQLEAMSELASTW